MNGIAALVLAGGRGERLGGVRKADLKFAGERLIDRAAAVLEPYGAPFVVSVGRFDPVGLRLPPGAIALPDRDLPLAGPLAGLVAMAAWLDTQGAQVDRVVSLAVDTPLVPRDFVPRMAVGLPAAASAAYATCGESFYPTNAIWRRPALGRLAEAAQSGRFPRSLRAFLQDIGAVCVDWPSAEGDPFANVNTLADLLALQRRAGRSG